MKIRVLKLLPLVSSVILLSGLQTGFAIDHRQTETQPQVQQEMSDRVDQLAEDSALELYDECIADGETLEFCHAQYLSDFVYFRLFWWDIMIKRGGAPLPASESHVVTSAES